MGRVAPVALSLTTRAHAGGERGPRRDGRHPVVEDGRDGLGALPDGGPGLDGPFVDDGVEVVPGDHVPVGGEARVLGPGQVQDPAEGVGPQPGVPVGPGQGPLDPHVGDLAHRAGCQPVAAGLLAGKDLLLHHGHVPARLGQPVGARGPGRAAAHHQDVVHVSRASRRPRVRWERGERWGSRPPMVGAEGPGRHTRSGTGIPTTGRSPRMCLHEGVRGKNKFLWTITCQF